MTPFPSAERELAELERLIAFEPTGALATNVKLRELKQKAERLALRLGNPVRVAIVGLPGSGKTTLANFLAGQRFAPAHSASGKALPVILRYGAHPETIAGWWSGIEIPHHGVDPEAAAVHNPDYVEIRLPIPVLHHISFLDMPGVGEWSKQKEQVMWVGSRADVVIWTTRATEPWVDEEWQLWSLVPKRVQARSLLAVSHIDLLWDPRERQDVVDRLAAMARNMFAEFVAIATASALGAAPEGRVLDATVWENSGGRKMVGALVTTARAVRRADIAAAREVLAAAAEELGLGPRPAPQPEPPAPAAGPAAGPHASEAPAPEVEPREAESAEVPQSPPAPAEPEAPAAKQPLAAEPEEIPAEPPAAAGAPSVSPLLAHLQKRLDELVAYAEAGDSFKDWEFMSKVTDLGDELSAMMVNHGSLTEEGAWVRVQMEDAFVTLSLLQMEPGERPCQDAATVLLQLARDLAWASARSEAA